MATKSYSNIDKPVQLVEIVNDAGGGTAGSGVNISQTGGNSLVADDAASGTTAPVPIGGEYNTAPPTYTSGDRVQAKFNVRGNLLVSLGNSTITASGGSSSVAFTDLSNTSRPLAVGLFAFDGTNLVRLSGDSTGLWTKAPPSTGTDRSITATTTSQQLMAANTARSRFFIKNDTAIVVWINLGATAVASAGSGNMQIAANGGYYELEGYSGVVNIIAASATPAITAREFS